MNRPSHSPTRRVNFSSVLDRLGVVFEAGAATSGACSDDSDAVSEAEPTRSTTSTTTSRAASSTSTTSVSSTTTTSEAPTLEDRIVAAAREHKPEYQDFWGDNEYGIVFFHHGNWSVEAIQWSLTDRATIANRATPGQSGSSSESTPPPIRRTDRGPDCIALPSTRLTAVFSGSGSERPNRIRLRLQKLGEIPVTGTRTVCSAEWDDSEPCIFPSQLRDAKSTRRMSTSEGDPMSGPGDVSPVGRLGWRGERTPPQPVGPEGSERPGRHSLQQLGRGLLIETGPDQSRDVAYGLPSVSGAAFASAGGPRSGEVDLRLANSSRSRTRRARDRCNTNVSECRRETELTHETRPSGPTPARSRGLPSTNRRMPVSSDRSCAVP